MLTPIIVLGGMMSGFFTPTEAAAVACVYSFFLGFVVYRTLSLSDIFQALLNTVDISARILFIVALAGTFGWILNVEQVANLAVNYLSTHITSPALMLLVLNLLLLFLGCFINLSTLIILLSPLVFPIIYKFGIDPIHFGVLMILNLMIGQLTPPVGIMSFIVMSVAKVPLNKFLKNMIPYFIVLLIVLALVTYFPKVVLFIPDLIMGVRTMR